MLTPVDVQNKAFKGGIGFDKRDVETFMKELSSDYEMLYRSNVELKDKVNTLDESLQYYRSIEDSAKKALTLAEKTAEETVNAANDKARQVQTEAEKKAEGIVADAKQELIDTKKEILNLQKQYEKFKEQFTFVLESQLKIMQHEMEEIDLGAEFIAAYGASYTQETGLGGLAGGGGYTGASYGEGFERTNQDPAFDRGGSLNMDPFADAMNGGGRFSRQTGGDYTGASSKKTAGKENRSSGLNVKEQPNGSTRVKKNFTVAADKQETTETVANEHINVQAARRTQPAPAPAEAAMHKTDAESVSGDVESRVQESNMLDSEDNYADGFDFVSDTASEQAAVTGEVESKVNESNMLDSEDNYSKGFDFMSEDEPVDKTEDETYSGEVESKVNESNMIDSEDNYSEGFDFAEEDDTYVGEVEERVRESNMLDSEDNYSDGFDFVVGEEQQEEIPTIFPKQAVFSEKATVSTPEADREDVLVGDVEDTHKPSNLIGNDENPDEGFNFL